MAGARRLHAALTGADLSPFRVVMLPVPDINIVCYLICHPSLTTLRAVNEFNERIYARMSLARSDGGPEYIISRTRLRSPTYDGAIDPILAALGVGSSNEWKASGAEGLVVLRSTVMDPFLAASPPAPDHVGGFLAALRRACVDAHGPAGHPDRVPRIGACRRQLQSAFTISSPAALQVACVIYCEGTMTVAELMQANVRTVGADASIAEAVVSLADAHISGMPVVDAAGRVIGVLSSTDVLAAEAEADDPAARQALFENTAVREIMTVRPFMITPDEDIREAARQMLYADVHRLFVAEGDQVVGIISTTDIVRAVATGKL